MWDHVENWIRSTVSKQLITIPSSINSSALVSSYSFLFFFFFSPLLFLQHWSFLFRTYHSKSWKNILRGHILQNVYLFCFSPLGLHWHPWARFCNWCFSNVKTRRVMMSHSLHVLHLFMLHGRKFYFLDSSSKHCPVVASKIYFFHVIAKPIYLHVVFAYFLSPSEMQCDTSVYWTSANIKRSPVLCPSSKVLLQMHAIRVAKLLMRILTRTGQKISF